MLNSHLPEQTPGPECVFFADLLPLLGEEALLEAEASETRAHLAICAYCQQEYAAYRRIDANLRRHFGALPSLRFAPEDFMILPDGSTPSEPAPETVSAPASDTASAPAPDAAPAPLRRMRPRRTRRTVSIFSVVAAVLVIMVVVTAIVVSHGLASQHTQTSHPISSPTPTLGPAPTETAYVPTKNDGFGAIQMLSPTEGWAVGSNTVVIQPTTIISTPLIVHYHDGHWWRVAAPGSEQLDVSNPQLSNISMGSPDEGWAVGGGSDLQQGRTTTAFILHYSGGRWTRYGSPMRNTRLNQVQMLSPTDGWMVGGSNLDLAGAETSLLLHYDGKRWTQAPAPPVEVITGLDMLSATDGWATGEGTILHYNGQLWTVFQRVPQIFELSMGSPTDGWAVSAPPSDVKGTLLWHYNGKEWVKDSTFISVHTTTETWVGSLSMDSATDGWALGAEGSSFDGTANTWFFLHYSQGSWKRVPMPRGIFVYTLTMMSADEGWAAGAGGVFLHYQHGSWSQYQF
ncbi:MAG TPA: hypothetical protein VH599_15350 [Ktedonobacterales bacterium]|jgi:hypothetical protein